MAFCCMGVGCLLLGILVALFVYGKWQNRHFKRKGVPNVEPALPFFGIGVSCLFQIEHVTDLMQRLYNQFPNEKYFGSFDGPIPVIILKDLELIKQLLAKEFDTFHSHRSFVDEDTDPMYGRMLLSLTDDKWRDMRPTLSPAFTGSKMKNMFGFVEECAQQMANHYILKCASGNLNVDIEAKDVFSHYTNDVIATAVFGLKVDSLENPDCEFYKMSKNATDFSGTQLLKFFGYALCPKLMTWAEIPLIRKEVRTYFSDIVLGAMLERDKHGIVRHDMIHLLMEAKKGSLKHESPVGEHAGFATVEESKIGTRKVERKWTDDDLVAQTVVFLIGGVETTSSMLTFLIYELARNPDVQQKLHEEIDNFQSKTGALTYHDLPKLKYLDMVVSESLRLWPSVGIIDRVASKNYTLPPSSESNPIYEIQRNESVWVPIFNIHRDPRYFPNPTKFDPERFSEENKASIQPTSYLPFGIGPRNCIGSRFALMVIKAIVFNMLANFEIVVTAKTQIPMKLAKNTFNMHSEKGVWVGLKLRENKKN